MISGDLNKMTTLDSALSAARADQSKGNEFYNAFLNSMLFFPLVELPPKENPRQITPVMIENEGDKFMMLFDTADRLIAWAKRRIPIAQLPGHMIVSTFQPDVLFVLNVGTTHVHQFSSAELAMLREAIEQSRP